MINVSSYTTALYALVQPTLAALSPAVTVERGERINFDPGRCPWAGVYPGSVSSKPHTIGRGSSAWMSDVELQVVLQTASFVDDGKSASDALETLIEAVLQRVDENLSLGISGARVVSNSREYRYVVFDDDGNGSVFMPQAVIKLQMEARSA